jgi:hypothetical protein
MIDALTGRVPAYVPLAATFEPILEAARKKQIMQTAPHFREAGDFRPMGLDVRLSLFSSPGMKGWKGSDGQKRETRIPTHRLEIYDTGKKTITEMRAALLTVFDCDPDDIEVTRIDLCADVEGVPVEWFARRVIVAHKRVQREIQIVRLAKGTVETWYAGKKPNQVRIYDKTAERRAELRRDNLRRQREGADELTFEEAYGYAPEKIVTRVERQYGGGRVGVFSAMAQLRNVNPFSVLEIKKGGPTEAELEARAETVTERLAGKMIHRMAEERGAQYVKAWIREAAGNSNAARYWQRYEPWASCGDGGPDVEFLRARYLESLGRQLDA